MNFVSQPPRDAADIELAQRSIATSEPRLHTRVVAEHGSENTARDSVPLLESSERDDDDSDSGSTTTYVKRDYEDFSSKSHFLWQKLIASRCIQLILFSIMVASLVVILSSFWQRNPTIKSSPYWQGFSKIEQHFAFGDSWTMTFFDPAGEQPSTTNPLGNPEFPGNTSSNGLNYVGYLATKYNHSFIKAYDFAFGGSTIDTNIDHSFLDWLDFYHQLRDRFMKYYTKNENGVTGPSGWAPQTSIFSTFFGINDVFVFNHTNPQFDKLFDTYENMIDKLYDVSARNFLIMNIPPMDRSPAVTTRKPEDYGGIDITIHDLNGRIRELAARLRRKYKDITVFEFDVHALFEGVVNDPQSYPQTAGYKDTMNICSEYEHLEFRARPTRKQIELCGGLDLDEYLWINTMHVTAPVHDAIAAGIERLLLDAGMD